MIAYEPHLGSVLWERKCREVFSTIEELKHFVAEQRTKRSHYIGEKNVYSSDDVVLLPIIDYETLTGWRNFCHVILEGSLVGTCGELQEAM